MNIIKLAVFSILCVSLNAFAIIESQIISLKGDFYQVPNLDYTPTSFFVDGEAEFIDVPYITNIQNSFTRIASNRVESFGNYRNELGVNLLDITIQRRNGGAWEDQIDATWGWNEDSVAVKFNQCLNDKCRYSWEKMGLKTATVLIDDGDTFYAVSEFGYSLGSDIFSQPGYSYIDLLVGEPFDKVAFWNQQKGFTTSEEYFATTVPLPAGIYLFLSGLVGLGLMRGKSA